MLCEAVHEFEGQQAVKDEPEFHPNLAIDLENRIWPLRGMMAASEWVLQPRRGPSQGQLDYTGAQFGW